MLLLGQNIMVRNVRSIDIPDIEIIIHVKETWLLILMLIVMFPNEILQLEIEIMFTGFYPVDPVPDFHRINFIF